MYHEAFSEQDFEHFGTTDQGFFYSLENSCFFCSIKFSFSPVIEFGFGLPSLFLEICGTRQTLEKRRRLDGIVGTAAVRLSFKFLRR